MPRYALLLAYDGAEFCGWWRQPGRRSVAGVCDAALARLGESGAQVSGVARTDSGVHAQGQVAQVDCQRAWDPAQLCADLTAQLDEDCVCRGVAAVADDWDAREQCLTKTYRYRFDVGAQRNPFLARTSWRAPGGAELASLRAAAALVQGRHDFSAFARRGDHRDDHCCHLSAVEWDERLPERWCCITGDRFTYRLVRSLVAAMWQVARGASTMDDLGQALAGTLNDCCRQQAPAKGLCLESITLRQPLQWQCGG